MAIICYSIQTHMPPLDELQKRLFRKKDTFQEREQEPTLSPAPMTGPRSWGSGPDSELIRLMKQQKQKRLMRYALFATVGLGVVALIGAALAFVFLGERASVTKDNIFLVIEAPSKITVGEEVPFEVRFRNNNSIPLESVDIIFEYPEGARPLFGEPPREGSFRERVSIGRLMPNEEHRESFKAFLFGNEGDTLTARATLEYRPQNSSARFGKDIAFDISVERSPVGVVIGIPNDATSGQEIEIVIDYVSTTESLLKNVSLDILYPSGFTFSSASLAPSKDNNLWYLGDVPSGGDGTIRIRGTIVGNADESKLFTARVGLHDDETSGWSSYGQALKSLVMRDTLLAVAVGVNETQRDGALPGHTVNVTITWQNNLPVSARNVVLEAKLLGEAIDYARVRSQTGSYDSAKRQVVWTASQIPEFRFMGPGETGSVEIAVPIQSSLPVKTLKDKNFVARVEAVLYTNTVPEGFAGVETAGSGAVSVNVITQMGFVSRGLYRSGVLKNTGPLPPRVEQETTYTVMWSLTSSANDIEGVTVQTSLPANVEWKNVINPSGEHVTYDSDTREVVWDAGFVVAGTGYTRPAREVSFQVGIVPGVSDIGRSPALTGDVVASGRDTFTGFVLEESATSITTRLSGDPSVAVHEYSVEE